MTKAFLEITLNIAEQNRSKAGAIHTKYKQPFLSDVPGARSKNLLIRDQGVQDASVVTQATISNLIFY